LAALPHHGTTRSPSCSKAPLPRSTLSISGRQDTEVCQA
jgi:hypothetical protein